MFRTNRVLSLIFISCISIAFGQKGSQSPYSIFGLGELNNGEYSAFTSMGGVLMANSDSTIINHLNPATYSYFNRHYPIFQVATNGRLSTFSTSTDEINRQHFGLNQFQLGIPIKNRWGASLGLMPYSFTGYTVSSIEVADTDTSKYINEGSGGISKVHFGLSYRPLELWKDSMKIRQSDTIYYVQTNDLSLGFNINYLFGSAKRNRSYEYVTYSTGYNSRVENGLRLADVTYDVGFSYQRNMSKRLKGEKDYKTTGIGIGGSYSPARKVKAYQDLFSFSYLGSFYDGAPLTVDTVQHIVDSLGSVFIPEAYRFGLEYRIQPAGKNTMIRLGADVNYQKWSAFYLDFGTPEDGGLRDRMSARVGMEITPAGNQRYTSNYEPYLGRLSYRLGFNYTQTELNVLTSSGTPRGIDNYGMSFGVGIPIAMNRSYTNINLGASLGNLGTTDNGLIQERYVGLYFGISITPGYGDLWFIKRKYD